MSYTLDRVKEDTRTEVLAEFRWLRDHAFVSTVGSADIEMLLLS